MTPDLSIVIPAFNEEKRITTTLNRVLEYLSEKELSGSRGFLSWEIIVVDDGSSDRTVETVRNITTDSRLRIVSNPVNMGKGAAVKNGVLSSAGDVILFSDADLSTPIEEVEKMMPLLESGADIIVGSRALPESAIIVSQPWYRKAMGRIFNLVVWVIAIKGFKDTQCGFKCFKRKAALSVFNVQRISGFAFDVEILYIAGKLGLKVKDVPVRWINSPDSRVKLLQGSLSMLKDILKIRLFDRAGYYGQPARSKK